MNTLSTFVGMETAADLGNGGAGGSAQSLVGDVTSRMGNDIKNAFDQAKALLSHLGADIGTFVANIWQGGFAGVSDFEQLKASINTYADNVQEIINSYNAQAELDSTFQGKAGEELRSFITATKALLDAYVGLVKKWNTELDDIYTKYQSGDTSLQSNVSSDAQTVQRSASNIELG